MAWQSRSCRRLRRVSVRQTWTLMTCLAVLSGRVLPGESVFGDSFGDGILSLVFPPRTQRCGVFCQGQTLASSRRVDNHDAVNTKLASWIHIYTHHGLAGARRVRMRQWINSHLVRPRGTAPFQRRRHGLGEPFRHRTRRVASAPEWSHRHPPCARRAPAK